MGSNCSRICLISDKVTFLSSKSHKKDLVGCHFKISIAEGGEIAKLGDDLQGYVNRIAKSKLCDASVNKAKEMKSLLSFANAKKKKVQEFNYKPYVKSLTRVSDPLSTLSADGKKVLEKLRHFVRRDQVASYLNERELSADTTEVLQKIASKSK